MKKIDQLLEEFTPLIARVAATFEANNSLREELMQEISLAVWRALDNTSNPTNNAFRGDSSLKTFIAKIAHNKAVDHVLKEQRCKEFSGTEITEHSEAHDHTFTQHDKALDLMAALHRLDIKYRQVLSLQLEGFHQLEIAQMVGLSEAAVAKRLSRARQKLASIMEH